MDALGDFSRTNARDNRKSPTKFQKSPTFFDFPPIFCIVFSHKTAENLLVFAHPCPSFFAMNFVRAWNRGVNANLECRRCLPTLLFFSILFDSWAFHAQTFLRLFPIILRRSLAPKQISLDCWADGWLWVRRHSGLRWERMSNKIPTREWKRSGSYLFNYELYYNGLMTDLGLYLLQI